MFLHSLTSCSRSHLCWIISSRLKCISPSQPARRHAATARITSPMAAAPQGTPATPGGPLPAGPGGPGGREGAEQRLLEHVRATAPAGDAQAVLNAMDSYAWNQEWFMNVGDVKGSIVSKALADLTASNPPKTLLELGTYCGYSAIRIASALQQPGAKLYAVDVSQPFMEVARQMIAHAGLSERVVQVVGPLESCTQALRDKGANSFDFVFIDHVKQAYLQDLLLLRDQGFLHDGSVVVADNLLTPGAPDYIAWMEKADDFEWHPVDTFLEYSKEKEDIVGISVYRPGGSAKAKPTQ